MILEKSSVTERMLDFPSLVFNSIEKQVGASLFLVPHPDDEALGCGGFIRKLRDSNIPVIVVFVTDGGASHLNSKTYPRERLIKLRREEALESCRILGVEKKYVKFLNLEDGNLNQTEEKEKAEAIAFLQELVFNNNIRTVFLPWRRDPHPDHKASYSLGENAFKKFADLQKIEYPVWLWHRASEEDWPLKEEVEGFCLEIGEELKYKEAAIFAHRSQTSSLIDDDSEGFVLDEALLSPFLNDKEVYFFNFQSSPSNVKKDYFESLYSENTDPWDYTGSQYEKEKYEKIHEVLKDKRFSKGLEIGCSIGVHTKYLAEQCDKLLALDISEKAIEKAKKSFESSGELKKKIEFRVLNVAEDFPEGSFDFISLCEVGYYFNRESLWKLFEQIDKALVKNGYFLMVHWTSFVREHPLTGRQVHRIFEEFNQEGSFQSVAFFKHPFYILNLWQK